MKKLLILSIYAVLLTFTATSAAATAENACNVDNSNDNSSLTKWSWYCWNVKNGEASKPTSKGTYIGYQCPESNNTQCGPNTPGAVEIDLNGSNLGNFPEHVEMPYKFDANGLDVFTISKLPLGQCGRVQTDWIETNSGAIAGGVVRKSSQDCFKCTNYKTVEVNPIGEKDYLAFNKETRRKDITLNNVDINAPIKVTSWWGWAGGDRQREGEVNEQKNETSATTFEIFDPSTDAVMVHRLSCIDFGNLSHIKDGFGGARSPFDGGNYFQCGNNNSEGLSKIFRVGSSNVRISTTSTFTGLDGASFDGDIPPVKLRGAHYNKLVVNYCAK